MPMSRHDSSSPATRKAPQWSSHLRQFSRSSLDKHADAPQSPNSASSHSTIRELPYSRRASAERRCVVTVNESLVSEDVLLNFDLFEHEVKPGTLMAINIVSDKPTYGSLRRQSSQEHCHNSTCRESTDNDTRAGSRYLFIAQDMPKDLKARYPNIELYVAKRIADAFGMKTGSNVTVTPVDASNPAIEASHVELSFKDQYLSRSDMWRLTRTELAERTIYKGQSILFLGTIKARITAVYVEGRRVQSAYFGSNTKPIFRSESARYVLFIQMSREMWDFDSDGSGEIMFNKVVNGFLPALFKKWEALKVKHLVSIAMFARVEYDAGLSTELAESNTLDDYYTGVQPSGDKRPYKDFYRIVVTEVASGEWTKILYQLKREFNYFRRDISLYHQTAMQDSSPHNGEDPEAKQSAINQIKAESSLAMYGNFLEAINMASSLFAHDYIDRDLMRTGISVAVITAGPGVFEVDYDALRRTTEALVGNGMGIDLICVPKMPLHSVPLFRYRNPNFRDARSGPRPRLYLSYDSTPKQQTPLVGSYSSVVGSFSPSKATDITIRGGDSYAYLPDNEWCFALPQWLHVSFWDGTSGESLSYQGIALSVLENSEQKAREDFTIRCRMYDLQMRSVLETNEIETAPLHTDPNFPTRAIQSQTTPRPRHTDFEDVVVIHNKRVPDTIYDHVHGFQRFAADRHSSHHEKVLWKQLREFDDARARLPTLRRARANLTGRELEEGTRRQLLEDSTLFGTSVGDRRTSVSAHLSSSFTQRTANDRRESMVSVRKPTDLTTANSNISPMKTPKFMRQISLGQRGFGIAAPKAVAAEVKVETVGASRAPAQATRQNSVSRMTPTKQAIRPSSSQTFSSGTSTPSQERSDFRGYGSAIGSLRDGPHSRPIVIRSAQESLDGVGQGPPASVLATTVTAKTLTSHDRDLRFSNALRAEDAQKAAQKIYNSKLLADAIPELPSALSPTAALSPWLSILNPSNPTASKIDATALYSRWQHVFPRPLEMKAMKWRALCAPASVPLTTEYFPSKAQFENEYQQQPYNISQELEDEMSEEPRSREELLRELVGLRFSQGFQVIVGRAIADAFGQKQLKIADVFSRQHAAEDGTSIFMTVGNIIHQLSCVNGSEIEVNIYIRKSTDLGLNGPAQIYKPAIRTILDRSYRTAHIDIVAPRVERNWNYIDSHLAGHDDEMSEHLRFWRARFVFIPIPCKGPISSELDQEEIRLEGIRKLGQLWQKHRYTPPSERRFQSVGRGQRRDPNPLDIVYKTEDPSVVIAAELETLPLLEGLEAGSRKGHLVTNTEQFHKTNVNISALAEAIQQPVEGGGVRMQNRRWHLTLYHNCFIGSDMTSWLLDNFDDLATREEAVDFGNMLMTTDEEKSREKENKDGSSKDPKRQPGLFVHVSKRHAFKDGQYFYRISPEYAKPHQGWFNSRRRDQSTPATPMTDTAPRDSPRTGVSRPTSIQDDNSPISGTSTPTAPIPPGKKPKVVLSKVMKYDVDHRKRSYRPERIDLHYDRLHNPDNCYHVRIDWINVTAKLIEDAIELWARETQNYGLRLVEVPLAEACSISDVNPFRRPYIIKLAERPPKQQPTTYYEASSLAPQAQPGKFFYQRALLHKFDFVLDMEAASNFPSNVDVSHSWGKPDFKYTQFIHRSGVLLAEITDEGDLLILANRVYSARAQAAREKEMRNDNTNNAMDRGGGGGGMGLASRGVSGSGYPPFASGPPPDTTPFASPIVKPTFFNSPMVRAVDAPSITVKTAAAVASTAAPEPEAVKDLLEAFCRDAVVLKAFYKEAFDKGNQPPATTPRAVPVSTTLSPIPDAHIPVLGLGASVLGGLDTGGGGSTPGLSPGPRLGSPAVSLTPSQRFFRRGSVQEGMPGQSFRDRS